MGLREIRDARGMEWRLWDVTPSTGMLGALRLRAARVPARQNANDALEQLRGGWLVAESARGERRRLVPIPAGWAQFPDAELLLLLGRAEPLAPRRHTRLHVGSIEPH